MSARSFDGCLADLGKHHSHWPAEVEARLVAIPGEASQNTPHLLTFTVCDGQLHLFESSIGNVDLIQVIEELLLR